MTLARQAAELSNWSKSTRSACYVYAIHDRAGVLETLEEAHKQGLSLVPHGAGHSYTDAALNTSEAVMDITPMRRILSWDSQKGIMQVEAGVTLQEMIQVAWKDGWWPVVSPSTARVTIGGCAAMNINGRNAWKTGPFGATILALEVAFPTGEVRTLTAERDSQLFHAVVGSIGLLGVITSITVQLQPLGSGCVSVRKRSAAGMNEIFALFAKEENGNDFMEAWLDGFARGERLGRGQVTCAAYQPSGAVEGAPFASFASPGRLEESSVSAAARLVRPALLPGVKMANRINCWWGGGSHAKKGQLHGLIPFTFWPEAFFTGYPALLPEGVETFQAFVPHEAAPFIFKEVLRYSQEQDCWPLWCVIKKHRRDPFLLSYQLDGFSMELNYARAGQPRQHLQRVLAHMITTVIEAGGRFYLAKDHFLTPAQYRQSMGEQVVETFLAIKKEFDPEMRLQSDLFRRLFRPGLM